jgi:endonuclease YncB( thermonuclease family)
MEHDEPDMTRGLKWKFWWLCAAWLTVMPATTALAPAAEVLPGPVPARLVRVVDGDTVVVRARIWLGQEVEIYVRLAGIDAPELRGKCAFERALAVRARDFVAARLQGGQVRLSQIQYGKYAGRVVARVHAPGGADLSAALLNAGLAHPYRRQVDHRRRHGQSRSDPPDAGRSGQGGGIPPESAGAE